MRKFSYTQRDVGMALGRNESTISEELSVLKSPEDVQKRIPYFIEDVYNQKRLHSSSL